MTVEFDPTGDFSSIVDNLEMVTLRRPGSSLASCTDGALRRSVSTSEAEKSGGEYTLSDVVWHLPADDLAEPPRPADVVVDADAARWTILAASSTSVGRWQCVCRNLAIVHGLDQFVNIERAVYEKDARGAHRAVWHTWRTGLAAKIQPLTAAGADVHQQAATVAEFRIFLAEWLELDHSHRIKDPDGQMYSINGYKKPDRIDALVEIDARRVT